RIAEFIDKAQRCSPPMVAVIHGPPNSGALFDVRLRQCIELIGVGLTDAFQERQCRCGLVLVDLREGEPDVDEDPVAGLDVLVLEEADVDGPAHAADVHLREVLPVQELDHLTWDPKTHTFSSRPSKCGAASAAGALTRPAVRPT